MQEVREAPREGEPQALARAAAAARSRIHANISNLDRLGVQPSLPDEMRAYLVGVRARLRLAMRTTSGRRASPRPPTCSRTRACDAPTTRSPVAATRSVPRPASTSWPSPRPSSRRPADRCCAGWVGRAGRCLAVARGWSRVPCWPGPMSLVPLPWPCLKTRTWAASRHPTRSPGSAGAEVVPAGGVAGRDCAVVLAPAPGPLPCALGWALARRGRGATCLGFFGTPPTADDPAGVHALRRRIPACGKQRPCGLPERCLWRR